MQPVDIGSELPNKENTGEPTTIETATQFDYVDTILSFATYFDWTVDLFGGIMDPKQISSLAKLLRDNGDKVLNSDFRLMLSGKNLLVLLST